MCDCVVCVCMCALRLLNSRCGMRLIDLVLNAKINIIFLQQQHQMKRDVVVVVVKRGKEQSKQARQNENMFKVFYYLSFGSDLYPPLHPLSLSLAHSLGVSVPVSW